MKVVFRFSYMSAVLSDAKSGSLTYPLKSYVSGSKWENAALSLDLSKLPEDYNGDNYDLWFDEEYNFVKAERDLNKTNEVAK